MDYRIEALDVLLKEDCILQLYYPLIPYKEKLLRAIKDAGFCSKDECIGLSDDALLRFGLPNYELVNLFRRFLVLYDVKDSKFKDINANSTNKEEYDAIKELYLLPGVKSTRARLYYDSGFRNLNKIATAQPEQIIQKTSDLIARNGLNLKVPLLKEVKTHIAVAKAFTEYSVKE